jgi:hypothetical protein
MTFLKMRVLIKVFDLETSDLTTTFLNFISSLKDTGSNLFFISVGHKDGLSKKFKIKSGHHF